MVDCCVLLILKRPKKQSSRVMTPLDSGKKVGNLVDYPLSNKPAQNTLIMNSENRENCGAEDDSCIPCVCIRLAAIPTSLVSGITFVDVIVATTHTWATSLHAIATLASGIMPDLPAWYSIVSLGVAKCIGEAEIDILVVHDSNGSQTRGCDRLVVAHVQSLTARNISSKSTATCPTLDNARPLRIFYGDSATRQNIHKQWNPLGTVLLLLERTAHGGHDNQLPCHFCYHDAAEITLPPL
jgi:hypothetical protein